MTTVSDAVAALQPEAWTQSLNDATTIYVTGAGGATLFKPTYTYPIFGDAETIFGYQGLEILLCFDSTTFLPFLNVRWLRKLASPDVDPKTKLMEFLPPLTVYKDEAAWRDAIDAEQKEFVVPGKSVASWTRSGNSYTMYKLDQSPQGRELLARLQILVLLFIEAGLYIDHADPLWDIYVMYEEQEGKLPELVGFATAYNYWKYPGAEAFDAGSLLVRKKISQFVVLPTHQGKRLGSDMYTHLFDLWHQDPQVVEIVVEDPSEAFDDLRDRADLTRLVARKKVDIDGFSTLGAQVKFLQLQAEEKLEKRQLQRLLEMAALYCLKHGSTKPLKKDVRLFVKRRLYEKNKDALLDLDDPTRKDKLQTAYQALEDDYYRVMEPLKFSAKRTAPIEASLKVQKVK